MKNVQPKNTLHLYRLDLEFLDGSNYTHHIAALNAEWALTWVTPEMKLKRVQIELLQENYGLAEYGAIGLEETELNGNDTYRIKHIKKEEVPQ